MQSFPLKDYPLLGGREPYPFKMGARVQWTDGRGSDLRLNAGTVINALVSADPTGATMPVTMYILDNIKYMPAGNLYAVRTQSGTVSVYAGKLRRNNVQALN
jgi:hypothetical protein